MFDVELPFATRPEDMEVYKVAHSLPLNQGFPMIPLTGLDRL